MAAPQSVSCAMGTSERYDVFNKPYLISEEEELEELALLKVSE